MAAETASAEMSGEELATDIAIIGGGPVGLHLAAELAYRGIRSIVVEKRTGPSSSARAVLVNSRTMEHMRRLGLEQSYQNHSYPRQQPMTIVVGSGILKSSVLFSYQFSSWGDAVDGINDTEMLLGFNRSHTICPSLLCPQFKQERLLKEHIDSTEEGSILWGFMATSITQDEDGVTVKVVNANDLNTEKTITAKFAVGCDGGKSWVRKQLGLHNLGKFVVRRAASITFKSPELTRLLLESNRLGLSLIANKVCQGVFVSLNTEGDFAFHLILNPSATDEEMTERCRNAKYYVQAGIGRDDVPVTIVDAHEYKMHGLVCSKFHVGCVLLAGDAAHQWVPAGGLGLNTGYQDSSNLAWKLAAMIKGWGGPHLLESYEVERRPLAYKVCRFALEAVGITGIPATSVLVPLLEMIPPVRWTLQYIVSRFAASEFAIGSEVILGYQYADSNIVVQEFEDDPDSHDIVKQVKHVQGSFHASSLPGCRAPHVIMPESPTIHDIFGKGFVLLVIGGAETDCEYLREELKSRGVPFEVRVYPKLPDLLQYYDRKYYLIRPDGDISWRSLSQPSFLEAQHIAMRICGDIPYQPFPASVKKSSQTASILDFVTDLSLAAFVVRMFERYSSVSASGLIAIGLGVATLSTVFRNQSHKTPFIQGVSRHQAWIATKFGPPSAALTMEPSYVGSFGPNDVLIRVRAASVNRIDMGMRSGYGAPLFARFARQGGRPLFPLILGRDCSGEVVAVGDEVTGFSPGQEVYTAVSFSRQGTHAQYVAVDESEVSLKPDGIDHREAASLPWVAVTVWTALVKKAGLTKQTAFGKRILVHGGTGGVGSFAIQMLKAWGADVVTTCSGANVTFAHSLGADVAIDYTSGDFSSALAPQSFDIILDTVKSEYEGPSLKLLKAYSNAKYVSIRSPYMQLTSAYGCFMGSIVYQWIYRYKVFVNRLFGGRAFYYSIAEPDGNVLDTVRDMVEKGEIRPIIGAVYSKDEMVAAHEHVAGGHTRGKVIVDMS